MSAFIVDNMHINAIVSYAIDNRISYYNPEAKTRITITANNAEEIGRILMDENVRSVCHRYGDADQDQKSAGADYAFRHFPTRLTQAEITKACACLEYQSCENTDWEESLAWRILYAIVRDADRKQPGYQDAPWEIRPDTAKTLKHVGTISINSLIGRR